MKKNVSILFVVFCLLLLAGRPARAQEEVKEKQDTSKLPDRFYLIENKPYDSTFLPTIEIKEVAIVEERSMFQWWKDWRYRRLIHNVKKVYPYAVVVRERLVETMDTLAFIPTEKEKKQYLKQLEKEVLAEYEDDMKKMTLTQGKILIKLIDRETQNTSFDLIREYRSGVTAFFWQGIARILGTNLKSEYEADGEDKAIEMVVRKIEEGVL